MISLSWSCVWGPRTSCPPNHEHDGAKKGRGEADGKREGGFFFYLERGGWAGGPCKIKNVILVFFSQMYKSK